ncbi:MAG TPA: alpha-D-ribose 1-methylphosphonate 5-triphosphate diphosphatase [Devosia sp.]|nr:alpha-D-ribose 1-methylphosphonate 5-triphosphate diphosphatase [Devosia sp.]
MWFSDFTLVLPDQVVPHGAVRVEGGEIAEIRDVPVSGAAYEGGGRLLMPGFVDLHGDMIEREIAPRPNAEMPIPFGIFELDKKLASAGVTTAYAALSFSTESVYGHVRSLETTSRVIDGLHALRDELLIDHRVHARYEITNVKAAPALEALLAANRIHLVSLTDHTPGQGQYRDVESYIRSVAERRAVAYELAVEMVQKRIADRQADTTFEERLRRVADHARRLGLTLASHDDDTAEKVTAMHALGVTISEFPVSIEAARKARELGLWTLMGAPNALRGKSMSGNLSALEAAEAGLLTILGADYHPAAFVMAVLRVAGGDAGLPRASAMVSRNPALAAGLADRGEIVVGRRADLVAVEPGDIPRVRATFSRGRAVYSDGRLEHLARSVPAASLHLAGVS